MITDILGGKTGAADTASSTRQAGADRKGDDVKSGAFSDALSNYDRDVPSQQPKDALDDDAPQSVADDQPGTEAKPSKPKPIIDIRPDFLPPQGKAEAASIEEPSVERDGKPLTPAEKRLREALLAAKAAARKSEQAHEANAADAAKQDGALQQPDEGPDTSVRAADDAKVADMLSLLTQDAVLAGAVPKNAVNTSPKRSRDADERSENGLSSLGSSRFGLSAGAADQGQSDAASSETKVPGTGVFRFTNARNESRSLDMTVGGGRDERTTVEFKSSSNAGAENVTVLDSRRFLGLAPSSNGANLAALISGDTEWSAAMQPSSALSNAAAQSGTGTVVNMLKLQLNPQELGSVMATLRLQGEALSVHLTVETRAAYRQLSEDSGGIVDALRAQGFSVDQVTIRIAPTADADSAGNQQGQSGQAGQQGAAEGGRQGFAAGRGQDEAGNRRRAEQDARTVHEAGSENAQHPGSGNARSGQLYL